MLVFAAEPVLQTTSSSFLAFVTCNLIILVILLGSKFGGSRDPRTMEALPVFSVHRDLKWVEIPDVEQFPSDQIVCLSWHEKQREEKLELAEVCEVEINREEEIADDRWECTHEEEKGEEDDREEDCDDFDGDGDDELKRRIEDFIAKVNREWAAENLKEGLLRPLNKPLALTEGLQPLDEPMALVATSGCAPC